MRRGFVEVILFCLILTSFIAFSLSINTFSCQQINTSAVFNITKSGITSLYNFSVATEGNFTALNLTIPATFAYIENSANTTLYPNWNCSNYTANMINCSCPSSGASANGTTTINVWFNAISPPDNETVYNFTVFVRANQTNATANTTIGNDGNITFIGNVSGVTNDTIVQNQNITIIALVQDAFSGINLSQNNSVQLVLNYADESVNKTYNMSNITSYGTVEQNNFSATFDTGTLSDGAYYILINATDRVGNNHSFNSTKYFNITPQPDLIVESIVWNSAFGNDHPYSDDGLGNYTNITINVTVKNNGTADVVNSTNITFKWDTNKFIKNENLNKTLLTANGGTQNFTYFIVGSSTNSSNGLHTIYVKLNTENNQTEKNENNNEKTEQFYIGYNITVLNITPTSVSPGKNITVKLQVKYGNGDNVTDILDKSNFTIYDKWNNENYYIDFNQIKSLDASQIASGIYSLNYTTNNSIYALPKRVAKYGPHYIGVKAEKGNYSGWINNTNNNYTINAPNLVVWFDSTEDLTKDTEKDEFKIKFKNDGNKAIENITIKIQTNNSALKMATTETGNYGQSYLCKRETELSSSKNDECNLYLKGTSTGTYELEVVYAYGAFTDGTKYNSTSLPYTTITVADPPADDNDDNDNTNTNPTDTTTTTTTYECTVDLNCSSTEFCNSSKKCQKRTCSSSQLISNHKCVTININTIYNSTHNIKQGESITIPLYLNSTKYKVTSVYLKATKPADFNGNVSITPSSHTLTKNILKQYNITFTMPANARFKKEYIIAIAVKKGTTKTFATANITLVVSGGNSTKIEISESVNAYEEKLKKYLDDFENIKSKLDDEDQSSIDARTSKVNRLIEEISGLIENEEYMKADEKITELNTEMQNLNNSISDLVEKAKKKQRNFRIFLFVVFIFAGIGAITYYMLLPDEAGYIPKKGFVKKSKKQEVKETIIEIVEEAKDELKKMFNKKEDKNPLKKRVYNYKKQY